MDWVCLGVWGGVRERERGGGTDDTSTHPCRDHQCIHPLSPSSSLSTPTHPAVEDVAHVVERFPRISVLLLPRAPLLDADLPVPPVLQVLPVLVEIWMCMVTCVRGRKRVCVHVYVCFVVMKGTSRRETPSARSQNAIDTRTKRRKTRTPSLHPYLHANTHPQPHAQCNATRRTGRTSRPPPRTPP